MASGFQISKQKLVSTARIAPRQSDEIYLLNFATPHSAKICGGVLEVKRLLQVNSSGLEQWTPAFKERFPLSAPMLRSAFAALDLQPIATRREVYDLQEFFWQRWSQATARCELFRSRRRVVNSCLATAPPNLFACISALLRRRASVSRMKTHRRLSPPSVNWDSILTPILVSPKGSNER